MCFRIKSIDSPPDIENMQLIYRRTPMPRRDFNKITFQLEGHEIKGQI